MLKMLPAILQRWQPHRGFSFGYTEGLSKEDLQPGLQGTEMWLAIIYLMADYLGSSDCLTYRPKGVHRPEPGLNI